MVTNPANGRVMEKAVMKYDASLRKRFIDKVINERVDIKLYSIMKYEENKLQ